MKLDVTARLVNAASVRASTATSLGALVNVSSVGPARKIGGSSDGGNLETTDW